MNYEKERAKGGIRGREGRGGKKKYFRVSWKIKGGKGKNRGQFLERGERIRGALVVKCKYLLIKQLH